MEALLPVVMGHPIPSILVCAVLFRAVDQLLQRLPMPKVVQQDKFRAWRWRNLSLSMVHSLLTHFNGTYWKHWMLTLLLHNQLVALLFSGYFAQDACDIIYTGHARVRLYMLLLMCFSGCLQVLGCFLYSLCTQMYVSGAVVALFVEVNSVTLHLRLLLKLAGAQTTPLYQINKVANIVTYVVFRLLTQFYLTWYILHNYSHMDNPGFFLICMMIMNIMILIYFYRLLRSDFFPQKKTYLTQNGTHNSNSRKFLTD
uniref:TLC domain-containing protein n=1 Tax=Neogobius melanostomus TaxID=47308 RepID=A0A8C6TFI3_9GOBI